jgi:hypothetical protein
VIRQEAWSLAEATLDRWFEQAQARPWVVAVIFLRRPEDHQTNLVIHLRPWPGRRGESGLCLMAGGLADSDYQELHSMVRELKQQRGLNPIEAISYVAHWMLLDAELDRGMRGFPSLIATSHRSDSVAPFGVQTGTSAPIALLPPFFLFQEFRRYWSGARQRLISAQPYEGDWRYGRVSYRTVPPVWLPVGIPVSRETSVGRFRALLEECVPPPLPLLLESSVVIPQWANAAEPLLKEIAATSIPPNLLRPPNAESSVLAFARPDVNGILHGLGARRAVGEGAGVERRVNRLGERRAPASPEPARLVRTGESGSPHRVIAVARGDGASGSGQEARQPRSSSPGSDERSARGRTARSADQLDQPVAKGPAALYLTAKLDDKGRYLVYRGQKEHAFGSTLYRALLRLAVAVHETDDALVTRRKSRGSLIRVKKRNTLSILALRGAPASAMNFSISSRR